MANWSVRVVDGTDGNPIEGAAVTVQVDTSCCPNCTFGGCSCGSCTSGPGYSNIYNTDSTGQCYGTFQWTTKQGFNFLVTANGYNDTNVKYSTGFITGDVKFPDIQLTPLQNVPQTNQGAQGAAKGTAANAGANVAAPLSNFSSTDWIIIIVLVVAAIGIIAYVATRK